MRYEKAASIANHGFVFFSLVPTEILNVVVYWLRQFIMRIVGHMKLNFA